MSPTEAHRPSELVSVPAAARELGVSRASVYRWIHRGDVSAVRVGPSSLRIRREDVDALVAPLTHDQDPNPMSKMLQACQSFEAVVDGVRERVEAGEWCVEGHPLVLARPTFGAPGNSKRSSRSGAPPLPPSKPTTTARSPPNFQTASVRREAQEAAFWRMVDRQLEPPVNPGERARAGALRPRARGPRARRRRGHPRRKSSRVQADCGTAASGDRQRPHRARSRRRP